VAYTKFLEQNNLLIGPFFRLINKLYLNEEPIPKRQGAFHFFAPISSVRTAEEGGRRRKGLRQE